jgi:uncharacterized RDD family membrane protein YckC
VPAQPPESSAGSTTSVGARAALPLRLAAMIYEAVLLFGVVFIVSYGLLALAQWTYPLPPLRRAVLQTVLFVAIGAYFVSCWSRSGQTLALKTWELKVIDAGGRPPTVARAIARYVLAWHLWLPGALWVLVHPADAVGDMAAFAVGFALLLLPALADPQRRLLHDRATGTRIVQL